MLKIKDVTGYLEQLAPLAYQEEYDNSGLIIGNSEEEVQGILITLDTTEAVIDEAIQKKCNLIVSHHPIIFKGLKKLVGKNYVERTVLKAIKNNIAIYAIHTNLDNVMNGVNYKIAEQLGLKNLSILAPKNKLLKKLITFIPLADTEKVVKAIHDAGAGKIGNYSECSFQLQGTGTFRPNETADPTIGEANKLEHVKENRVEVIFPSYLEAKVLAALMQSHPYEVPAYDLNSLDNAADEVGAGVIGELETPLQGKEFLNYLKDRMNLISLRHTVLLGKSVKRIAICGGSGSFLLKNALHAQADVFITADFKYHEFFDAEEKIVIADIGHYESEVFTKDLIHEVLKKKISNIALVLSNTNTNPIRHF